MRGRSVWQTAPVEGRIELVVDHYGADHAVVNPLARRFREFQCATNQRASLQLEVNGMRRRVAHAACSAHDAHGGLKRLSRRCR